jgi:hypothetical protein
VIKPGLLMWIFKDKNVFYIRILNLFGFGWEFIDSDEMNGIIFLFGVHKYEIGIHFGKRRGNYVKRIENEKSPTASA